MMNQKALKQCRPKSETARQTVILNDSQRFVTMNVGQELELVVGTNTDSGYKWFIDTERVSCMRLISEDYKASTSKEAVQAGTTGQTHFVFKAYEACKVPDKIGLNYDRAWNFGGQAGIHTKEVTVEIKDNSADQVLDMRTQSVPVAKL